MTAVPIAQAKAGDGGFLPPVLTEIDAEMAFTCGERNITVIGTNFQAGATVRLTKSGETDVVASQVNKGNLQDNKNLLRCMFDIADAMTGGLWSLVVTNPDGQSDTLTDILEVVPDCPRGEPGDLYVSNHQMKNVLQFDGDTGAFVCIFADVEAVVGKGSQGKTGELLWAPNGHLWVTTVPPFGGPSMILEFDGETGAFIRFVLGPENAAPSTVGAMSFGGPDGNLFMQARGSDATVSTRRYANNNGRLTFIDIPLTVAPPMVNAYHARFASNGNLLVTGETSGSPLPTFREYAYDGKEFQLLNEWIDNGDKRGFTETPDGCCYAVVERNLNRVDLYDVDTLQFVSTLIPSPEVPDPHPCGIIEGGFAVVDPETCWSRMNQLYDVAYGPNGHVFVASRSTQVPWPSHVFGSRGMGAVHEFDPATGEQTRVIGRQDSWDEFPDPQRDKLYHAVWLRFKPFPGDFTGVGSAFSGDWRVDDSDLSLFADNVMSENAAVNPHALLSFDLNRDGAIDCDDWPAFTAAFEASSGYAPELPVPAMSSFASMLVNGTKGLDCCMDLNSDGQVNGMDVQAFIELLVGSE